jgi:hypothetical protein
VVFLNYKMTDSDSECGYCHKIVNDNDIALECDFCHVWEHCSCVNISTVFYDVFKQLDDGVKSSFLYVCTGCKRRKIPNIAKSNLANLQCDPVENLCDTPTELTQPSFRPSYASVTSNKLCPPVNFETTIKRVLDDQARVTRAVGYKIPESKSRELATIINDDLKIVKQVVSTLGVDPSAVVDCQRLGRAKPDYVRPIKIHFKSQSSRDAFLSSTRKLKNDQNYGTFWFRHDLTREERDKEHKLREELKERREKGETNLMIFRGNIVIDKRKQQMPKNTVSQSSSDATKIKPRKSNRNSTPNN